MLSNSAANGLILMDGGEVGELEFENFNAASAKIVFKGTQCTSGYAKNKMINRFIHICLYGLPEHTEGTRASIICGITGAGSGADHGYLHYSRSRPLSRLRARKEFEHLVCKKCRIWRGYEAHSNHIIYNMREKIEPVMHIIDTALKL